MGRPDLARVLADLAATVTTDGPRDVAARLVEGVESLHPGASASVTLEARGPASVVRAGLAERSGPPLVVGDPSPAGVLLAVTISHRGERLGVVEVRAASGPPADSLRRDVEVLADVAASYLVNARFRADLLQLHRAAAADAGRDELTGLANRRSIVTGLDRALRRGGRPGHSATVLFVDLDQFKAVNDGYGHRTGDELLVAVGQRLVALSRPGDTVGRLSGDEFVVLFDDVVRMSQARAAAERVRSALALPFDLPPLRLRVTASVGATLTARSDMCGEDLLDAADGAMYEAKRQGGDRVRVVHADHPSAGPPAPAALVGEWAPLWVQDGRTGQPVMPGRRRPAVDGTPLWRRPRTAPDD